MAKRKSVGLGGLAFNRIDPYGESNKATTEATGSPTYFNIETIAPDPQQPRRLLPEALATLLHQGQLSPVQVLQRWREIGEAPSAPLAQKQAIARIKALAETIAQQGLINPITIRPTPVDQGTALVQYWIITGERRWWAHVWLTAEDRPIQEGQTEAAPDRIKATVMAEGTAIRAQQMIENVLREDIGLMDKANGLTALRDELMALYPERSVTWQDVETLLGMSRAYRTRILRVLNLSPQAQALVEENNLTERAIRPITEKLAMFPDLQLEALRALINWQQEISEEGDAGVALLPQLEYLVEQLLARQSGSRKIATGQIVTRPDQAQRLHQKIQQTLRYTSRLQTKEIQSLGQALRDKADYQPIANDLRALRNFLNALLPD